MKFQELKQIIRTLKEEIIDISHYIEKGAKISYEELIEYENKELSRFFIQNLEKSYYFISDFIKDELSSLEFRILNLENLRMGYSLNDKPVIELKEKDSIYSYIYHESLHMVELIENQDRIYSKLINV